MSTIIKICNFCNLENELIFSQADSNSAYEFNKYSESSSNDEYNFTCRNCGSTAHSRHFKMYFDSISNFGFSHRPRILHFAPDKILIEYFKKFKPELHILADLKTDDPRYEIIDIQNIPYSDSSFDIIIANHILENIESPESALEELNRVIAPNGIIIIQTKFSLILNKTFQDSGVKSPEAREYFYGGKDKSRLFGKDIFDFYENFLSSNVIRHDDIFTNDHDNINGINYDEPFFFYTKKNNFQDGNFIAHDDHSNLNIDLDLKPLVSILCLTYNHEVFIKKTLESLINQKTEYSFEIIVFDDCSTDNTFKIINEFVRKYPSKVKANSNSRNIGGSRNFISAYQKCRGKFIAICDGDDYWCDSLKIQKQADYLLCNPECVVTYGNVQAHCNGLIDYNYCGGIKRDISKEELSLGPAINTLTTMFRKVYPTLPPESHISKVGDMFLWSMLGHHGYGHYCHNILPSIYSIHDGGVHSKKSLAYRVSSRMVNSYSLSLLYERVDAQGYKDIFLTLCRKDLEWIKYNTSVSEREFLLGNLSKEILEMARGDFIFDAIKFDKFIQKHGK